MKKSVNHSKAMTRDVKLIDFEVASTTSKTFRNPKANMGKLVFDNNKPMNMTRSDAVRMIETLQSAIEIFDKKSKLGL